MKIKVKKLNENAIIPQYQSILASGFDFHAVEDLVIPKGETRLVKTGLSFEVPEGYEMQIRPRSGTSLKTKLRICNSPGTIDADYRGEVCIIMENTAKDECKQIIEGKVCYSGDITIEKGDRIAQGVICPVIQVELIEESELTDTQRGIGGFGSTYGEVV